YNTNYNVLDNRVRATETWLRGGFEWKPTADVTVKNQFYGYHAARDWVDSETYTFDPATGNVDRDRFFVGHHQNLVGTITDMIWRSNIAGMDNRFAAAVSMSHLDFFSPQSAIFPGDTVTLVNPNRGLFLDAGPLVIRTSSAKIDDFAVS